MYNEPEMAREYSFVRIRLRIEVRRANATEENNACLMLSFGRPIHQTMKYQSVHHRLTPQMRKILSQTHRHFRMFYKPN